MGSDLGECIGKLLSIEDVDPGVHLLDFTLFFRGILLLHNSNQLTAVANNSAVAGGVIKVSGNQGSSVALGAVQLNKLGDALNIEQWHISREHHDIPNEALDLLQCSFNSATGPRNSVLLRNLNIRVESIDVV